MSIQTHVQSLNAKHAEIEEVISAEEHRPIPDTIRLMNLKRKKLKIKEEIGKYSIKH